MSRQQVMVAVGNAEHVESLVELGCRLATGLDADLTALHVVEVGPGLPIDCAVEALDRPGNAILSRARQVASETFHKEISTKLVRGREAGTSIVQEVANQGTNLLVLGYHEKNPLSNWLLGSTVEYVACHPPCRVIAQIAPPNGHRG
jgi:nucleotide-binding universal stress UspA family protein